MQLTKPSDATCVEIPARNLFVLAIWVALTSFGQRGGPSITQLSSNGKEGNVRIFFFCGAARKHCSYYCAL
jgi:hypothetical protein